MAILQARVFPHLAHCDVLSASSIESHLRLYAGYVGKYNALMDRLQVHRSREPGVGSDTMSLKCDVTFALGAIKNHELFFDCLGPANRSPEGPLAETLARSFHSVSQYLVDLKQTARLGRGWAWTAYDLDHGYLFNYEAGADNGLPVWNSVPILAIDLYGHAHFYDYGNNRQAYVEAVLKAMDWQKVAARLKAAMALAGRPA